MTVIKSRDKKCSFTHFTLDEYMLTPTAMVRLPFIPYQNPVR